MSTYRGNPPNLGKLLGLFIGLAIVYVVSQANPGGVLPRSLALFLWPLFTLAGVVLALVALVRYVLRLVSGSDPCPACRNRTLGLNGVLPFSFRYYQCGTCGRRWKRKPFGAWDEVAEGEAAFAFERPASSVRLEVEPWEELDGPLGSKAIDRLVRSQRARKDDGRYD